jgi:hypothetical protein
MDPSENSFEDQWRKALRDASETPPPSVWEGIEAHLDQGGEKGMVLPLWWQSRKIWYAAASFAALLLVGAGIWYSGRNFAGAENGGQVAIEKPTDLSKERVVPAPAIEGQHTEDAIAKNGSSEPVSATTPNANSESSGIASSTSPSKSGRSFQKSPIERSANVELASGLDRNVTISEQNEKAIAKREVSDKKEVNGFTPAVGGNADDLALSKADVQNSQAERQQQSISAELLSSLPYSDLDVHVQKRYVFFRPELKSDEPVKLASHKEYWAGVGLMPASFNPDLKVKEAPLAFSDNTLSNKKAVSGSSEPGMSYAVQTQGGMRISKHWSVELGVSYLKGNSDYRGGGYVLSANNSISANVLENALAGLASSPRPQGLVGDKSAYFANNGSIYIDVSKKVSNNYQYLQLPVQAGFTLNPDKKLSYSVLGGVMANYFISNDLESASGEIITTTASDEIYRSMNWAATTGLRFNYRLTSKWKASLTGSYQKAISSGFRSNQSLDARPYLYGVSWGVRYSF